MNILITGANGLLGRHLAEDLRKDHCVHALVRSIPANAHDDVSYHIADLGGAWDESRLPSGIDAIFHLAQSENFRNFPDAALDIYKVNVNSTARLLDYAKKSGVKKFIYASSGGVYGAGGTAFDENAPVRANDKLGYYIGSKICGEVLTQNYAALMTTVIARFFFIYGRGQKRGMLLPRILDSVRDGRAVQLQGKDGLSINPVHVSDAVAAMRQTLDLAESATYNVAGPHTYTLRQVAEIAGGILNKAPVFAQGAGDPLDVIADISRMKQSLIAPRVHLQDGLKDLVE